MSIFEYVMSASLAGPDTRLDQRGILGKLSRFLAGIRNRFRLFRPGQWLVFSKSLPVYRTTTGVAQQAAIRSHWRFAFRRGVSGWQLLCRTETREIIDFRALITRARRHLVPFCINNTLVLAR